MRPHARALIPTMVLVMCAGRPAVAENGSLLGAVHRWHVEHDIATLADVVADPDGVVLRFQLAPGRPTNQFAAAVVPVPRDLAGFARLVVTVRANRPMRIAIQLRGRDDLGAPRWRRTMYVDGETRSGAFELADFRPVEPERTPAPPLASIAALMLGVDTVNTRPGTRASIAFAEVRFER